MWTSYTPASLGLVVGEDYLHRLFGTFVHKAVSVRRPVKGEAVRDELLQAQTGQQAEYGLHSAGGIPARAEIRVHPPDLRGLQTHPSAMEMSPERERDGLRTVPGGHNHRPLGCNGVYGSLQSRPGPANLDRHVRAPSGGGVEDALRHIVRPECFVGAHG